MKPSILYHLCDGMTSIFFTFTSCPDPDGENGEDWEFIDQVLQGKIGGVDWEFVSGTAEGSIDTDVLWMDLYNIEPVGGNPWGPGAYNNAEDRILFSVPENEGYSGLGFYKVFVTLYD